MSTKLKLTAAEYDAMIERGAFVGLQRRIELIRGELREMSPIGPIHEDYVDILTRWSVESTNRSEVVVRVQSSIDLGESRPEPDLAWLRARRFHHKRPQPNEVLLVIEVADRSLAYDTGEKAALYAESNIPEYWVVDTKCRHVLIHRQPQNSQFRDISEWTAEESIAPQCRSSARLALTELFVT